MKYYDLDQEEQSISEDFDQASFESLGSAEQKKYTQYAKSTLAKTRNINIRLSEKDIQKAKFKAVQKGVPYQTLVSSIIHQYVNDQIPSDI